MDTVCYQHNNTVQNAEWSGIYGKKLAAREADSGVKFVPERERERLPAGAGQVLQLENARCHYALIKQREKKRRERPSRGGQSCQREQKGQVVGRDRGETREASGKEESSEGSERRRRL